MLWALPSVALPASPVEVVQQVADAQGEYPAKTGWNDLGLAADAPSYTHDKDTEGLEYEQPSGLLFEEITEITREITLQIAELDLDNLKLIENSELSTAVAASAGAAAAAAKTSAYQLVHAGLYSSFREFRIALISYRPTGAGVVTEPGPPIVSRPPAVCRIIPLASMAAEDTELEFEKGEPVNGEVTLTIKPDPAAGAKKEHGYWAIETPGAIAA
jgi:hypothetical protein